MDGIITYGCEDIIQGFGSEEHKKRDLTNAQALCEEAYRSFPQEIKGKGTVLETGGSEKY